MKTWEYRIIKHDTGETEYYAVHEVYFDKSGKAEGWTEEPVSISGDNQQEVQKILGQMAKNCKNSVLNETKLRKLHG